MKFSKLILAVVGATVLLAALTSAASAGRFSASSQKFAVLFRRMDFSGGLGGTVECEVLLEGSLHSRTLAKVVGSLIGYITKATVLRCARGSATIRQESLPWHRRYASFSGTLPNITSTSETVTGAEWTVREPGGITCSVTNATNTGTNTLTSRTVTRTTVSGRARCGGFFEGTLSATETNIAELLGAAPITVTLI